MLSIYTLPEAVAWLSEQTGSDWSESALFDAVCKLHLTLRAAPPLDANAEIHTRLGTVKDFGEGILATSMGWRFAVLHPVQVQQVWQVGETEASDAVDDSGAHGEVEETLKLGAPGAKTERWFFTEPVRVTRDMVRITPWTLTYIIEKQGYFTNGVTNGVARNPAHAAPESAASTQSGTHDSTQDVLRTLTDDSQHAASESAPAQKRQTWRDAAWSYVCNTFKNGSFTSGKTLFKELVRTAGEDGSPFKSVADGGGNTTLIVTSTSKPLSLKTLQNAMTEIRKTTAT